VCSRQVCRDAGDRGAIFAFELNVVNLGEAELARTGRRWFRWTVEIVIAEEEISSGRSSE